MQRRVRVVVVVLQRGGRSEAVEPEGGRRGLLAQDPAPVLQQGERLGLQPLHELERSDRPGEGLLQGRHDHPGGSRERRGAARRQLGLEEAHRLRRAQEPGRHLLHELSIADSFLHESGETRGELTVDLFIISRVTAKESRLQDADGERRHAKERRPRSAESVLRAAVQRSPGGHEEADEKLRLGDARLVHAARRAGNPRAIALFFHPTDANVRSSCASCSTSWRAK